MRNEFYYVALDMDCFYDKDIMNEVFERETGYFIQELVRCAVHMYENNDYDEQTYFQLIWKNTNTDFTLDKNNILEQLGTALKHFEDKEEFEFCADIKQLIDKIKNNI